MLIRDAEHCSGDDGEAEQGGVVFRHTISDQQWGPMPLTLLCNRRENADDCATNCAAHRLHDASRCSPIERSGESRLIGGKA
jgi:hypothetical protein